MPCPTDLEVSEFLEGKLIGTALERVSDHLAECVVCRAAVGLLAPATVGDGSYDASRADLLEPGDQLGRYLVVRRIGRGGMGVVFEATDTVLHRRVALKVLHSGVADEQETVARRVLREARAMAKLSHPNVVGIYDTGSESGTSFIAMEYVQGDTLASWLVRASPTWPQRLAVLVAAGRGLAAAHAAGLIHRDFKPANVLVDASGCARVTDFGLARHASGAEPRGDSNRDGVAGEGGAGSTLTGGDVRAGTPAYMAPEQLLAEPLNERTDQFNFCATAYEVLYGSLPFADTIHSQQGPEAVRGRAALRTPRSEQSSGATVRIPGRIFELLATGMERQPEDRHPSFTMLLAQLERCGGARRRRRRVAAVVGVCALAVTVAVVGVMLAAPKSASAVCGGAAQELARSWNRQVREQFRQAFQSSGHPQAARQWERTQELLEAYADNWQGMYVASCEATRVSKIQSQALLDLRIACLRERRQEFDAVLAVLRTADRDTVAAALAAARGLGRLDLCANTRALLAPVELPAGDGAAKQVTEVRAQLADARVLRDLGRYQDGLARAREAAAAADRLGFAPLQAEANYLTGELLGIVGAMAEAEQSMRRALWAAEASHHDLVAAQVRVKLLFHVAVRLERTDELERLNNDARAAIARLGGDALLDARRLRSVGLVYLRQERHAEAMQALSEARALLEQHAGPDASELAIVLTDLGSALRAQERYDEAYAYHQRALAIREMVLRPDHPDVAASHTALGTLAAFRGDYPLARSHFELALAVAERSVGPDNALWLYCLENLAEAMLYTAEPAEALALAERSVEATENLYGSDGPQVGYPLLIAGRAYLALQRADEALPLLERAHSLRDEHREVFGPGGLAESQLALARALWDTGSDRARAHALATDALAAYEANPVGAKLQLSEARGWLAAHPL